MVRMVEIGAATLYCGDALRVLEGLGPVDAVITDPPYSSGATHTSGRTQPPSKKYVTSDSGNRRLPDFVGDARDQRSFVVFNSMWAGMAYDITVDGGVIVTFTDWRQAPVTADYVQVGGWIWRGTVAWGKPAARPQRGRFTSQCEFAIWGSKGAMPADRGVPPLPGLYTHNPPRARQHITQKPLSLMEDMVAICAPRGTVLDPFMGSGTTGVAALASGRRFIGIEKSAELFDVAVERLRRAAEHQIEESTA